MPGRPDLASAALLVAGLGGLVILVALVFEHGFGYAPCPLCLRQRWPYYLGVPLALAAFGLASGGRPRAGAALLGLVAAVFAVSAGLGVHHAGIEWGFWAGPADCAGSGPAPGGGSLMDDLRSTSRIVRCDEAAWRFLGLSFAGWNVVASTCLAALAAAGAARGR